MFEALEEKARVLKQRVENSSNNTEQGRALSISENLRLLQRRLTLTKAVVAGLTDLEKLERLEVLVQDQFLATSG